MSLTTFSDQRTLFKAYDIRGERQLFTTEFMTALSHVLARHFVQYANANQVVIGFDARHHSETLARYIASSFKAHGCEVIWLGLVTTPLMAFWANQYQGHGVIATASHSEPHINGLKWLINSQSPSSEQIQQLYQQLSSDPSSYSDKVADKTLAIPKPNQSLPRQIALSRQEVLIPYINKAVEALDSINKSPSKELASAHKPDTEPVDSALKIVIDCLNGSTGLFAKEFYQAHPSLCSEVIMLNADVDGDFPKGNPDPMEYNRLHELSASVLQHEADLGLSFDGDGDRLMVIDSRGQPLVADHLLYLLSRVAIEDHFTSSTCSHPDSCTPTVIFDVKCSHHLPTLINQAGAQAQMSKTGSSILRRTLQAKKDGTESHNLFAGELSGHFIFNDGHFLLHDDAMYAGLRLLNWLRHQPATLAEIIDSLPQMVSTPDVYLPLADYSYSVSQDTTTPEVEQGSQPILSKLSELCQKLQTNIKDLPSSLPADAQLTCIDGLRLDFSYGFGIIRSSNTSNSLTVRFAGNSLSDLTQIQGYFVHLCQSINEDLANQVANIQVNQ